MFNNKHLINQNALSARVYDYYNTKMDDRNLHQATDGYVHHHFGLGPTLIAERGVSQDDITAEIQRQENALTTAMIEQLELDRQSPVRVVDLGCGRGGNMFRILDLYDHARVDGVNITHYQTDFCNMEIAARDLQDRAEVRQANFLSQPYPDNTFTHAYCCEVTQYALDLNDLFVEVRRTLQPGGRFVIATWCYDPAADEQRIRQLVEPINDHYASTMHSIDDYTNALKNNDLLIRRLSDVSDRLIPYWELRTRWDMASGIEQNFIDGHKTGDLLYAIMTIDNHK